jgi:hypothetical protein
MSLSERAYTTSLPSTRVHSHSYSQLVYNHNFDLSLSIDQLRYRIGLWSKATLLPHHHQILALDLSFTFILLDSKPSLIPIVRESSHAAPRLTTGDLPRRHLAIRQWSRYTRSIETLESVQ